jgi:dolichyl-phosphate beta-glucosyltransferase
MTSPELALVVPCYNEAARLDPEEFLRLAVTHPTVRLLMIDDGSVDATPEIPARMCAAAPASVEALHKSPRSGKAEAVRTGILAGIEHRAGLVAFLGADLSTPLRAIDDFLAVFRGRPAVEFALGPRVMLLGRDATRKMTRHIADGLHDVRHPRDRRVVPPPRAWRRGYSMPTSRTSRRPSSRPARSDWHRRAHDDQ